MRIGDLLEMTGTGARRRAVARVRTGVGGRGSRGLPARVPALVAVVVAALALDVALAAAPSSAAVVVGEPHLTLESTYEGELRATAHRETGGEIEDLKVTENFTVATEQRVDIHGDTIVLRDIKVVGGETGTIGDGFGGIEPVGCTLSAGEGHGPAGFTPEGVATERKEEEPFEEGGRKGEAFIGNPSTEYDKFSLQTFLPTDVLLPLGNEVTATVESAKSPHSCQFAVEGLKFIEEPTACASGRSLEMEHAPFAPEATGISSEAPPSSQPEPTLKGKCEKNAAGAEETVQLVTAKLTAKAVTEQAAKERAEREKAEREAAERKAEEEARAKKEAEERKLKEEEAARTVEVPKPPAPPPPPPPAEPAPEAIVAPEGPPPRKLTPLQLRRLRKGRTSPADRARNLALRKALTSATRVKAAKCTVALAVDAAVGAVTFVAPIPGEATSGGSVTDLRTRKCLTLLAQTRGALATALHDPPSTRYKAIRLPEGPGAAGVSPRAHSSRARAAARAAAAASVPCTASALPAAQFAACDGLASADRESDRQLERVALVAAAVGGTIDRHSGAIRAGRQGDAEFQGIAYNALIAELGQSLERAAEANLVLARTMGAAGTDVAFGRALSSHTPRYLQGLVKHASGAVRSSLRTLLGAAQLAVPSLPGSYRAALAARLPVGALADGGTFRPRELILLVRQLVKQSQIPSAAGAAMVAELSALKKAKGGAATTLRRQLGAGFRSLTTEAGPLLEAATRIRSPRL